MKKLILLAVFTLFTYVLHAQNATIQGVVIDEMNGQTIPGAKVILDSMAKFASSDFDGKFSFENLSVGEHYVTVKYPTYTTKKVPFDIVKSPLHNISEPEPEIPVGIAPLLVHFRLYNSDVPFTVTTFEKLAVPEISRVPALPLVPQFIPVETNSPLA